MIVPSPFKEQAVPWDPAWTGLDTGMVELYTTGTPSTIHQFWHRCYFEDLWAFMSDQAPRARYLELGSGRGTTSMYLTSRGCDVTMVDLAPSAFRIAIRNFAHHQLALPKLVLADARGTGLKSESYDCVFSIGLLEHFQDPIPVLVETFRLLTPGGGNFSVIIPEHPPSSKALANAFFCPWRLAPLVAPEFLKRRIRKWRHGSSTTGGGEILRTEFAANKYTSVLYDLGATNISCIPYNPYQSVYGSLKAESRLVVPVYRAHYAVKKRLVSPPVCRTFAPIAACDLLTFRKPL